MKRIFTLVYSLIFLSSFAQTNNGLTGSPEYVTDSIYTFRWNEPTGGWILDGKTADMSYHEYRLTSEIEYDRNASDWQKSVFHTYTYNDAGLLVTELVMSYTDSAWRNNYMMSQSWDGAGNMTSQLVQLWNGISWIDQQRITMTWDAAGNMLTWLLQTNNGSWVNSTRKTCAYTAGNITEEITERWQESAWVNFNRKQYTYDNSKLTTMVEQAWTNNAWANDVRTSYTYDNSGNVTNKLVQALSNGNWLNRFNHNYTFTNNHLMQWVQQDWDGSAWIDSQQELHGYDNNGNHTYSLNQIVKGDTWKDMVIDRWGYEGSYLNATSHKIFDAENVYGDSTRYFLRSVLGTEEKPANGMVIYPNPATDNIILQSATTPDYIEIYALNGHLVLTPRPARIINIQTLPTGTYILRATFGKRVVSGVFLKGKN